MSIEAMKQALKALELALPDLHGYWKEKADAAITSLRQAIEQAERLDKQPTKILSTEEVLNSAGFYKAEKREWVGLTLDEKKEYLAQDFGGSRADAMDWADKRLKEKNT